MALQYEQYYISEDEYLQTELLNDSKHEYINGEIYAMAGASRNHNIVSGNVFFALRQHLNNTPCIPFASDMKVKAAHCFFYPDVVVSCANDDGDAYCATAPLLIVEVLSKHTRRVDKTTKMMVYKSIPSLQEYVLIEQDCVDIEVCRRSNDWLSEHYFLGDDVTFTSIDLTVSVAAIYQRVSNDDMRDYLAQTNAMPN